MHAYRFPRFCDPHAADSRQSRKGNPPAEQQETGISLPWMHLCPQGIHHDGAVGCHYQAFPLRGLSHLSLDTGMEADWGKCLAKAGMIWTGQGRRSGAIEILEKTRTGESGCRGKMRGYPGWRVWLASHFLLLPHRAKTQETICSLLRIILRQGNNIRKIFTF